MDLQALLSYCQAREYWMVETIETLARLESPTPDKEAVDRCGGALARLLEAAGGRVRRLPRDTSGDHLCAEFGSGEHQVLLLGHFDTVWPVGQVAHMPVTRVGGRLAGPGVFDMKAGLVLGVVAVQALLEHVTAVPGRLLMLCTADEETGSLTSRAVIEDEARRSDAVLVLEPSLPGGAVKTSRKGCGGYVLTVTGIPAHAGIEPWRGVSAIHELARQVLAVEDLRDAERGITINVGKIEGGTRPNVVAAEARAEVDVRVDRLDDVPRLDEAFRSLRPRLPGASLEVTGGIERPPMERTAAVVNLYRQARDVARALGRPLEEGGTGGGSDGNLTAALGVPTLDGLGAVGGGAHALDEHVITAELPWRAALVAGLIDRIFNG